LKCECQELKLLQKPEQDMLSPWSAVVQNEKQRDLRAI
jgi:hypothetical protein